MQPHDTAYDELRLRIDPLREGAYRVLATTRSAEASATFELPFSELDLDNFIGKVSHPRGRRRIESSAKADARRFGAALFMALFQGDVRGLYRDTLTDARARSRGVRITLCLSGSPELIDVPWEYLCDEPNFLAVSEFTPVVRYLDLPRAHRPLAVKAPLRMLGIISRPAEFQYGGLDVDRERQNLERALGGLTRTGAVELHWLEHPTLGGLLRALRSETFHVLHYIGHGAYERDAERGVLMFEADSGWARPVPGDELGDVLHDFSSLRLAVLNACEGARTARSDPFAGVAGSLVQRDIPAVVAMQFEISDEAANVFATGFYEPIAAGSPVDASLAAARLAMLAERSDDIEWGTPVLFMRVPDGRIFDLDAETHSSPDSNGTAGGVPTGDAARGRNGSPKVLINFRRDDTSPDARLLSDRLKRHFGDGEVQADQRPSVGDGPPRAFLTLIGPSWVASLRGAGSARPTEDPVRRELERALRDYPDRVVPVVIDTAIPDAETLPRSLRALCRREAAELRHASFETDLGDLITRIEELVRTPPSPPAAALAVDPTRAVAPSPTARQVAAGVSPPYHDHFTDVVAGMLDGTVVPLLGPGAGGAAGTPDSLAAPLAERFQAEPEGLAAIAQRIAMTVGERRLFAAVRDLVAAHAEPTEVHRFLAAFPAQVRRLGLDPCHQLIIDANYDSGLERAFEDAGEPFDYAVYLAGSGWFVHVPWGEHASEPTATTILEPRRYVDFPIDDDGELERTIIVKIHGGPDGSEGSVAWRNNYVVTEDQYIDYLPTHNIQDHLPIQLLDKLTGSRCLFLGYLLQEWDARVFLRRIWRGNPISENSWAIERDPDPLEKASWNAIGHVELIASPLPDYVQALRSLLLDWRER